MMDAQALGRLLREAREARELTLADAEQALRIRRRILAAFEDGVFDLPDSSAVQLRGLLGNYARYLGLDDEPVLEQFEQVRQVAQRRQRREHRRRPGRAPPPQPVPQLEPGVGEGVQLRRRRRRNVLGALLVLALGAGALGIIVFVALQFLEDPLPASESVGEIPRLIPPTALPTAVALRDVTSVPGVSRARYERQISQNWNGSGVLVTVEAAQRTWLRLTADGGEEFSGMLRPGEHVEVAARSEILLSAGNGAALLITWNGQEQPVPGLRGQLVDMTFTRTSTTLTASVGFGPTEVFTATPPPTSAIDVAALLGTLFPVPSATLPGEDFLPTPGDTALPTDGAGPTATVAEAEALTPSATPFAPPTVSATPTASATSSATATPRPTATAVLPPRVTQVPLTPAKNTFNG
ncbi:MAG: helix-turn-helix domain-containing protein [Anaerolineaceae bacterium]|nr:helix-turn-helix domain-containing protein [Anaerolineaceae bacterium]MCY3907505.1 helix-turn-helix domain-containing protein [Anaerolineaceae bacterium]